MSSLVLVHGFLGQPEDWNSFRENLGEEFGTTHALSLWKDLSPLEYSLSESVSVWAQTLPPTPSHLFGYSLGGRWLLHLPSSAWSRVASLTLLSVHPGLESPAELKTRREQDEIWAKRFETEEWGSLMRAWNSQSVFSGDSHRPLRNEKDFSRIELAAALRRWSLGAQTNLWSRLKDFPFPVSYWHGERDEKFTPIAQKIKTQFPQVRVQSLPGGHSPQWSDPRELAAQFRRNLNEISPKR